MTEKKLKILNAAIALFSEKGYNATSTSKLAQYAGVSEGLIFRHFGNKEGLLHAILKEGEYRIKSGIKEIENEENPKAAIRKAIELTFSYEEKNFKYWRMQMKLQWELGNLNLENVQQFINVLSQAFKKLNCPSPELEAQNLLYSFRGISEHIIINQMSNKEEMKQFLIKKYCS